MSNITHQNDYLLQTDMRWNEIEPIVLLVKYEMGPKVQSLARGFGSVVKHSTADPGIASSIPPHYN